MKIAAGIEYEGTAYSGWQTQLHASNIQDCVQTAISTVADHFVEVVCAGRTDTGVHAIGQVVHFVTEAIRDHRSWVLGINSNLPPDIAVTWLQETSDDFHARFSARARYYRYMLHERRLRPAISRFRAAWIMEKLDLPAMQDAAAMLIGEHDFSAFRSVECQARSPVRTITNISVTREREFVYVDIKANAFLHHMVRNIVGTLLEVGSGKRESGWVAQALAQRDRSGAGITAPAHGLHLVGVEYPEEYSLPGLQGPPVIG